jgi:hypothetical protein
MLAVPVLSLRPPRGRGSRPHCNTPTAQNDTCDQSGQVPSDRRGRELRAPTSLPNATASSPAATARGIQCLLAGLGVSGERDAGRCACASARACVRARQLRRTGGALAFRFVRSQAGGGTRRTRHAPMDRRASLQGLQRARAAAVVRAVVIGGDASGARTTR